MYTRRLPNSKHCFACGVENEIGLKLVFEADNEGGVVGNYVVAKRFEGYPGIAHGGIVSTLLDEALSRAFLLEDPNRLMYTARLTTRFRRHVPVEQPITLRAWPVKDRQRMGEAKAQVLGADGEVLAEGEALLVALRPDELQDADLQALGWRVYSDEEIQG